MKTTGPDFMKATYPENTSEPPQVQGVAQPPLELPLPPGEALIALPAPAALDIPPIDLRKAIEERHSVRRYQEIPLSL